MKRLLVTGSEGFIGRHIVSCFASDWDVVGLDQNSGWDLSDPAWLEKVNGPFDLVVHLAGLTFVPESHEKPREYYEVNLLTTLNVAEYCRQQKVGRLLFPNTYVYGAPLRLPVDENHPVSLPSPYHRSKKLCEDLLLGYFDSGQTETVILRIFNLYGPGQSGHFLIPRLISQCRDAQRVEVMDLEPRRDFLHIDDFTALVRKVADSPTGLGGVYNVGAGESYSVAEVLAILEQAKGSPLQVVDLRQRRKNEVMDCIADIRKASRAFGWRPQIPLKQGIEKLLKGE